jgi:hypothetical protein
MVRKMASFVHLREPTSGSGGTPSPPSLPVEPALVGAKDLPEWVTVYNRYNVHGYRHPANHSTIALCLASVLWGWNNETLNFHLHIWPSIAGLFLLFWIHEQPFYVRASANGQWSMILTCMTTFIMGVCSSMAHALNVMSPRVSDLVWRLDYIGILFPLFARLCVQILPFRACALRLWDLSPPPPPPPPHTLT